MAKKKRTSILLIYTGGTIGMIHDAETGALLPFSFEQILLKMPELMQFNHDVTAVAFNPPIDSSDVKPELWIKLAQLIQEEYDNYDGFVVLHGTDTMAYSASALSFMFEGLSKPVIFTGSQLPIGALRTDGKENLISAIEIAAAKKDGKAQVEEVCIFFENKLLRGNRTTKQNVERFNAFVSNNFPPLAETGVYINFYPHTKEARTVTNELKVEDRFSDDIAILTLFPGISAKMVRQILTTDGLRAVILETYGAGNAMSDQWFIDELAQATRKGIIVVNISQCRKGSVSMGTYKASISMKNAGVISGGDMTFEATVTKLMILLGRFTDPEKVKELINTNIAGELTI